MNTSAEVKAEADVCCTSANAPEIVAAIPAEREVLFLPDQFLGAHVRRVTGRANLHVWMGECHVHAGISPQDLRRRSRPTRRPSSTCTPSAAAAPPRCGRQAIMTFRRNAPAFSLPAAMLTAARTTTATAVLVATETGMLHQLRKARPDVRWEPANPHATCHYMKMITAEALERCLRDGTTEVDGRRRRSPTAPAAPSRP